ncbi:MAG: glycosyltransferase [Cyanobacteria bacterium P01_G01_bin.67]
MTKISVIIPAYNAENTILTTVNSVLQQTHQDLEIIIINDGSSDRTEKILNDIKDSRLEVYSYENGGISTAKNRGIDLATGDYIAFLDADDCWTKDKLATQFLALEKNTQAGLAYSWVYFQYETEAKSYADTSGYLTGDIYPDLLLKNFLHTSSNPLIKTSVIKEIGCFIPELKVAEDWDLFLRIAAKYHFVLVPKVQIIYRQSDQSITTNIKLMEQYLNIVIERAFRVAPDELKYLKKQSIGWVYKYLTQQYIKYQLTNFKGIKLTVFNLCRAILVYPPNVIEPFTRSLTRRLIKNTIKQIIINHY